MAIRDADGSKLSYDAHSGVTVVREVVETTSFVETTRDVTKTRTEDGNTVVQPVTHEHARKLPRGLTHAPDGSIRTEDGREVFAPTDQQLERAKSAQRNNLAHEVAQAKLRHKDLTMNEIARGFYRDGPLVRDGKGKVVEVCGHMVDQSSHLRTLMAAERGVF